MLAKTRVAISIHKWRPQRERMFEQENDAARTLTVKRRLSSSKNATRIRTYVANISKYPSTWSARRPRRDLSLYSSMDTKRNEMVRTMPTRSSDSLNVATRTIVVRLIITRSWLLENRNKNESPTCRRDVWKVDAFFFYFWQAIETPTGCIFLEEVGPPLCGTLSFFTK